MVLITRRALGEVFWRDMNFGAISVWIIFVAAALLEVGGDAAIQRGLRLRQRVLVLGGFLALGCYGLVVNSVKWDFSKLIGVYIGMFALVTMLVSRWVLREDLPATTWMGLGLIVAGGLLIQFGDRM
jgi:small multidrug resistance family-3 protein